MNKAWLKKFLRKRHLLVVDDSNIGVVLENDLDRLCLKQPIETVFDVGGNLGQSALRFADAFPRATVYSFEPVQEVFAQLQQNVAGNAQIKALPLALGAAAGTAPIGLGAHPGENSLALQDDDARSREEVTVQTLDQVVADEEIACIDLLKIDVEGFELQVLEGARETLARNAIRFVYAECVFAPDSRAPHTSFFALHERLQAAGFCFVCCYTESFNLKDGSSMGNVLFAASEHLPRQVGGRVRNMV